MNFKADLARCGNNLRWFREQQRITIEALSALSGVAEDTIMRFEQGNGGDMIIANLLKLAEVLDVELSHIFSGPDRDHN